MVPFRMLGMVSYYCAIVTLSARRTVIEIFNFKNETGLGVSQGHWKCHHSIERMRLPIDVVQ